MNLKDFRIRISRKITSSRYEPSHNTKEKIPHLVRSLRLLKDARHRACTITQCYNKVKGETPSANSECMVIQLLNEVGDKNTL